MQVIDRLKRTVPLINNCIRSRHITSKQRRINVILKGDSNPNDKYVLSKRALWTMNFDISIIEIG